MFLANDDLQRLHHKANSLPLKPGVYLMKDAKNKIIYIGKAKNLKNRVTQYFGSQKNHTDKVKQMISQVNDFDFIITKSEFEALVLECSLIKQNLPKYNILLKDDKGYHYIRISNGPFPKITQAKKIEKDDATYLGPYVNSQIVKDSIDTACKIFRLARCNNNLTSESQHKRACLNYYIKQCSAPCINKIKKADYLEQVKEAIDFLQGGVSNSLKGLTSKMEQCSENLEFERAAKIRDRIRAIKKLTVKQNVVDVKIKNQDVIACVSHLNKLCFQVLRFEKGNLSEKESFIFSDTEPTEIMRAEFIQQYYSTGRKIPSQITTDGEVDAVVSIERWLSKKRGGKVRVVVPQKGETAKLISMCKDNAEEVLIREISDSNQQNEVSLELLKKSLSLSHIPKRIEAYDVSNLSGTENVAGMVVFRDGVPYKQAYRKFKIKSFIGQDDCRSMCETLERRFNEFKQNTEGFNVLPDLILLDGGKSQVRAIRKLLVTMNYSKIPVFGMVKDINHRTRTIVNDIQEFSIQSEPQLFNFITCIQDEVHRFVITFHRSRRQKRLLQSKLLSVPGIGETRANELLKKFKTVKRIQDASIKELMLTPKMNKASSIQLYNYFHQS